MFTANFWVSSQEEAATKCMNGRTMVLKADRALFGRMLVMGQQSNIDMKELMHHPLGPLSEFVSSSSTVFV